MSARNDRCGPASPANAHLATRLIITAVMVLVLTCGARGGEPSAGETAVPTDGVVTNVVQGSDTPAPEATGSVVTDGRDAGRRISRSPSDKLAARRGKA